MTPPVGRGDRILIAPSHTGLADAVWAFVDLEEFHPDPGELPWNTGPDYPWRVGYRITLRSETGETANRYGTVWMNASAQDAHGAIIGMEQAQDVDRRSSSYDVSTRVDPII